MGKNNRRNLRVACGVVAGAEGSRGPVKGSCRNLSRGGMFFLGAGLTLGQTLEFWIALPQGKVTVTGVVRYPFAYPDGAGFGIHFTRLTQDGVAAINDFIASSPEAL